jgi:hypothetical protein
MEDLRAKWREANRGEGQGQRGQGQRGGQRGGGEEMRAEITKLADAQREKLADGLGAFLEGRELEYAANVLGSFNPGWDNMVHAVTELNMEKKTTGQALKVIEEHIAETVVLRRSGEREGQREAQAAARAKLNEKMKAILDEEQFAKFQQSMGGRRGDRGAGRGGDMRSRFEQWDTNGDGKLQKDEIPEQMLPMFDRLDANGDGVIDEEEFAAMARGRGGQRGGQRGGRGGGGGDGF